MVVCEVKHQKENPNRKHITFTGIQICYPNNVGTPIGYLELVKIIISSVMSRRNSCFVFFDLKNLYLQTPMEKSEYVRIKLSYIPQEFIEEYNLTQSVQNGGFILIFYEVAMGYRSQSDSPMTCYAQVLRRQDTTRQPQHLVSGAINGAQLNLS